MKKIFPGIFKQKNSLYTAGMNDTRVYGERIIRKGLPYREWDPERSKLAAALVRGMDIMPFRPGSKVLYLGASTGTTVSHVSDIVGDTGMVYAIEFAERVIRDLLLLADQRKNIAPVLADARQPEKYFWIEMVDIVYADVAQPDETELSIRNARMFLKPGGYLFIAVKSRSIDVTKSPKKIYEQEANKLRQDGFEVMDIINLSPYQKDHCMIVAKA